jgi:hypothetical protein
MSAARLRLCASYMTSVCCSCLAQVWKCSTQHSQAGPAEWQEAGPLLRLLPLSGDAGGAAAPSPAPKQKQRRPQQEQTIEAHRILWLADDSKVGVFVRLAC